MPNDQDSDRRTVVSSVVKAADLLSMFTRDEPVLRIGELSRRLGWNRHTTARFVTTLTQIGWLERIDEGRDVLVRLGGGLLRYSPIVRASSTLREEAGTALRKLTAETSHTTYLMWKRGSYAVCLERVSGEPIQIMHFDIGDAHPLTRGGGGPAILAQQSTAEQDRLLDALDISPAERRHWHERAETVRSQGFNISHADVVDGISSLGVPLTSPTGATVAAISMATVSERLAGDAQPALVEAIRTTAEQLSQTLGSLGHLDLELGMQSMPDAPDVSDNAVPGGAEPEEPA